MLSFRLDDALRQKSTPFHLPFPCFLFFSHIIAILFQFNQFHHNLQKLVLVDFCFVHHHFFNLSFDFILFTIVIVFFFIICISLIFVCFFHTFSFTFDSVLNSSGNLSFDFPSKRKLEEFCDSERDDVSMDNQTFDAEEMDTASTDDCQTQASVSSTVLNLNKFCFYLRSQSHFFS